MTHLLIQPGSLARPQSAATAAIGLFVRHLDKTKERMLRSRYLGAGRLATVDKYYNLSYQKTMIIIIFPPLSPRSACIKPELLPSSRSITRCRGYRLSIVIWPFDRHLTQAPQCRFRLGLVNAECHLLWHLLITTLSLFRSRSRSRSRSRAPIPQRALPKAVTCRMRASFHTLGEPAC